MTLKNKVIVVTGASQGLGEALALKAAELGARVVLVAHTEKLLQRVKEKILKNGGKAECFVCDIRDLGQVKAAVKTIIQKFGTIDILVNNAGVWTDEEIEKQRPEQRKVALETNVLGQIQMTKEILPLMKKRNDGYIFNVISGAGLADSDNTRWQTYGASKWAMTGFTKALRDYLKGTKIKVTGFFPGGMDTNLYENVGRPDAHKQPWMMKKEDVADIIVFALTRPDDVLMEGITVSKIQ
ncbi:MAG: SDR family oxidoreductase [bacterium]|nr:SDR family oxidoreductase [bacterium]